MYCLYLIGENIKNGYIGVSNNIKQRFKTHSKSKYYIGNYIRKHQLNLSNIKILCYSSKEYCFDLENKLRPNKSMGMNIAIGGHGGYTVYDSNRSKKISVALKGREKSLEHRKNISKSREGFCSGQNNGNAKLWKFINPQGEKFIVSGNCQLFCTEQKILFRCLLKYKNKKVPPIISGTCGGYRSTSPQQLQWRKNTTNWMVN